MILVIHRLDWGFKKIQIIFVIFQFFYYQELTSNLIILLNMLFSLVTA